MVAYNSPRSIPCTMEEAFDYRPSASGVSVTRASIMGIPHVLNGGRLIANTIARTPLNIFKDWESPEKDYFHPATDLLTLKANPFQTSFDFLFGMVFSAVIDGDGFGIISRDDAGDPISLWNAETRSMAPVVIYKNGVIDDLFYVYLNEVGEQTYYPVDDIIHIKNINPNSNSNSRAFRGVNIADCLRTVLGMHLATVEYGAKFFGQGGHVGIIYNYPGWLDEPQLETLKRDLSSNYVGMKNAHKPKVIMGGAKIEQPPHSNEHNQWLETINCSRIDVANALGLSPSSLGVEGSHSYGSLEQDKLSQISDCFDAWMRNIEAEFCSKLLKPRQRKTHYIEFQRSYIAVNEASTKLTIEKYKNGCINYKEMRQELDYPTTKTGEFFTDKEELPEVKPELEEVKPELDEVEETKETKDEQREIKLTETVLERLKNRLIKGLHNSEIKDHETVIRENLNPLNADIVMEDLETFTEELNNVLSEQRGEVIKRWNTKNLAYKLWNQPSA